MRSRKYFLTLLLLLLAQLTRSQQLSETTVERLAYTAKVWGYLKYFHPSVDGCEKNMNSLLLGLIPRIKGAASDSEFNDLLREMFDFAGPVPIGVGTPPQFEPREIKHLQLEWLNSPVFRNDIRATLDSVKENARIREQCYYLANPNPTQTNPYFYIDEEVSYPESKVQQEEYRLMLLFRYWNIINYFYPYKYLMSTPWDSTLVQFIPKAIADTTILSYHLVMAQLQSRLDDAHGFTNSSRLYQYFGANYVPFAIAFREGKTVVTHVFDDTLGVKLGDVILSIDGVETGHFRDSVRDYACGSNPASKERNINDFLIRSQTKPAVFVLDDGSGPRTVSFSRYYTSTRYYDALYPIPAKAWKILPGDFGYVDMGNLVVNDVQSMYDDLANTKALIFDVRNYPQGTMYDICALIHPEEYVFVKFTMPDPAFAGSLFYDEQGYTCGPPVSNAGWYQHKVIILFNEETQSHAEFTIMSLEKHPYAVKIGSQTAGADGNVMSITLVPGLNLFFTSLGVYYPDWGETQRIGIQPDIIVHPTIDGIRQGRDEVLEEALRIASSVPLSSSESDRLGVTPHPFKSSFSLTLSEPPIGAVQVTLHDLLGKVVYRSMLNPSSGSLEVTTDDLLSGVYLLTVSYDGKVLRQTIVKE